MVYKIGKDGTNDIWFSVYSADMDSDKREAKAREIAAVLNYTNRLKQDVHDLVTEFSPRRCKKCKRFHHPDYVCPHCGHDKTYDDEI